jgi:ribosomal protein S18 acetylase RimI-like enzyme
VSVTVEIRPLTHDDVSEYRALRLRALQEHPEAFGSSYEEGLARPEGWYMARIQDAAHPADRLFGAFDNGVLIGTLGFSRLERSKDRHKGELWGMHVAQEATGRGVGRALLEAAIAYSRQQAGLIQVGLAVVSENARAVGLYQSLGFESYGREPRALCVAGRYLDEDLMLLRLD